MDQMSVTQTRRSYPGIDLVRFLCALLVIGAHVYPFGNHGDPVLSELNFLVQVWMGRIPVPFFLICTGFFLFRDTDRKPFPEKKIWNYEKKLLRLYLLWTVLYFPLILQEIILIHPQGVAFGTVRFAWELLVKGSYHHLWYLQATLVAIAIVGLLRKWGVSVEKMLPAALLLFFVGLLSQSYFGILMRLRYRLPMVWKAWEIYEQIFVTTRNGVFKGFLYIAIGAWFAQNRCPIRLKGAVAGFALSMALALVELLVSRHLRWLREYDLYVCQIPSAFFLFCLAMALPVKEHKIWSHLRALGNASYFLHVWVMKVLAVVLAAAGLDITVPGVHFLSTVVLTLLLAEGLFRLQKKPKLAFLRNLFG